MRRSAGKSCHAGNSKGAWTFSYALVREAGIAVVGVGVLDVAVVTGNILFFGQVVGKDEIVEFPVLRLSRYHEQLIAVGDDLVFAERTHTSEAPHRGRRVAGQGRGYECNPRAGHNWLFHCPLHPANVVSVAS